MQTTFAAFGKRSLRALTRQKAVIAILAMLILMLFFKTNFYTSYNLLNVLKDAAVNEIIAFGVTLTVIAAADSISVSASANGRSSRRARRRPTVDLPTPIRPTSTID